MSHVIGDRSEPILDVTIGDALRTAASKWPDRVAFVDGDPLLEDGERWTFADLLSISERTARALLTRFSPGDHVAIWAANCPEWILLEFGAALAGLTLVTANPAFLGKELAFVLRQSRCRGLFVQDRFRERDLMEVVGGLRGELPDLREVVALSSLKQFVGAQTNRRLPSVGSRDVAQIQYTSGTTGTPKGARLTHRGIANNARIYAQTIGAGVGDVWINPMPMFHTAGCGLATLGALQTGGSHVLLRHFDPESALALLERERGTVMLSVPTILGRMLDHPSLGRRDLSTWRVTTLGGAPVPPELVRRAGALGLKVAIGFGQTEASPYLTHTRPDDRNPQWALTVGPPMAGTDIKIVDLTTLDTVPVGVIGEIWARGYSVMRDYFDQPEATRAALDVENWLHTGDLGTIDDSGYCRVQGRLKDMIIRGGENIYPREVEDVLFEHPEVADASVVGVPDADWGEVAVAFIRLRLAGSSGEEDLVAFCRSRLASFKVPRIWRFVEEMPQTASGKTQKFALLKRYLDEEV
ncbi:MAG: AMP-binding protein [Janthinobacterium lividum]